VIHQPAFLELRPDRGTRWFRRKTSVVVTDGVLIATGRWGRTASFPMDGSPRAPTRYRSVVKWPKDDSFVFMDANGEALIILKEPTRWPSEGSYQFAEQAGLEFEMVQETPPLRHDGIRLRDSRWVEMDFISSALTLSIVLSSLAKFGLLDLFPWLLVILALGLFAAVGLFSGRYAGCVPEDIAGPRVRRTESAIRQKRARQKRRKRSRNRG
jgi:hypothetical protein